MTGFSVASGEVALPAQAVVTPAPTPASTAAHEFASLLSSIALEPPGAMSTGPSVVKEVALTQQQLLTTAMQPLPDLSQLSQPQLLQVLTRKFSDVTAAQMGFTVASSGASAAKKSVETVLNHK